MDRFAKKMLSSLPTRWRIESPWAEDSKPSIYKFLYEPNLLTWVVNVVMCDEYEIFEYLESENRTERSKRRRNREENDPFELGDLEFIREYRLSKDLVKSLCEDLEPIMKVNPRKSSDLSHEKKVLTALHVYAQGCHQKRTGRVQNIAQQTVSAALAEVTAAMNNLQIRKKFIKFPQNLAEREANKLRFYERFGIPGVIGCINGSHVALVRPRNHENKYLCEKNYHSLNVQLICNADMDIISVDASHPGACHASFIWSNHPLKPYLDNLSRAEAVWLLGDSGYPLRKTMMTPILNAKPNSPEAHYTEVHVRTRNVVGQTINVLKARFRCLLVNRVLHYEPHVAGCIVNACVILHNICNKANMPVPDLCDKEAREEALMQPSVVPHLEPIGSQNRELQVGMTTRRDLVSRLWELRTAT